MSSTQSQPPTRVGESDLSSRYVLAIACEVVAIAVLYWLGRTFG